MTELHDKAALAAHCAAHRVDPQHGRHLARLVLRHGYGLQEAVQELRGPVPAPWTAGLSASELELLRSADSTTDGATKWVFRASNGSPIESVLLRIASGRRALCLSIQSHCPVACRFCASGFVGKPQSLQLSDVLGQVIHARQFLRREDSELRNLVFMGMGEPLLEEELLHAALERLTEDGGFGFSPSRIVVSTVGLPEGIANLACVFPKVHLALSLHSARQEVRERLIPFAKRYDLGELRQSLKGFGARTGAKVLVEYLLLEGVNDGLEDELALHEWLLGLPVKLNLIPYNRPGQLGPGSSVDPSLRPTPRPAREAFAARMRARGVPTTLRYSLGSEISAACGQLAARPT